MQDDLHAIRYASEDSSMHEVECRLEIKGGVVDRNDESSRTPLEVIEWLYSRSNLERRKSKQRRHSSLKRQMATHVGGIVVVVIRRDQHTRIEWIEAVM